MSAETDAEFAEYVGGRLPSLRRLALLLCHDWHRADDLVQASITKLYVHWHRARKAASVDAYVRTIIVREFLHERRSAWARRVMLGSLLPDQPAADLDADTAIDLRAAIAALPTRQRAVLVLRYYCDLDVEHSAEILGCSPGTVKSQTARALVSLRRQLEVSANPQARRSAGIPADNAVEEAI
jgi:RNA polymerase sigma-70 factor (sigma-E family)